MPSRPARPAGSPGPTARLRLVVAAVLVAVLAAAGLSRCGDPTAPTAPTKEPAGRPTTVATAGYQPRTTPPPWELPADPAVAIVAAGLEEQPMGLTTDQHRIRFAVTVDGDPVALPAGIGIDRVRAVQAQVHTHDDSGEVWLEGRQLDAVTLGQFFALWGVRFTDRCLGAACGTVLVTTQPALDVPDPRELRLITVDAVLVTVVSD